MKSTQNIFPVYRKYVGVETYFKILGDKEFIEIKRVGKQYLKHHVVATQFPEMQFINDMMECYEGRWDVISKIAYEEFEKKNN